MAITLTRNALGQQRGEEAARMFAALERQKGFTSHPEEIPWGATTQYTTEELQEYRMLNNPWVTNPELATC